MVGFLPLMCVGGGLKQPSAYCGQRTRQCICSNRNVLGYVLFARGGSNFPMVTKGLRFPAKVSGSILYLWLHHNCINKDWSSQGQRLQLEAVSEASLLSTVLPCKQTGSVWIHWCHSVPLNIQLLMCFLAPGRSLCGCKWVLGVGANLETGTAPHCLQHGGDDTGVVLRVLRTVMKTGGFGDISWFLSGRRIVITIWRCLGAVSGCSESQCMLWSGIMFAQFTLSLCTSMLLVERLLGLGLSWLSPCRAGTYQWEALVVMEKLLQSEAESPQRLGRGKMSMKNGGKLRYWQRSFSKAFCFGGIIKLSAAGVSSKIS